MYLDPPWQYRDKALAGNRGAECKYPILTIPQLKELPIQNIADKDCLMFMWITMPKLNEVFSLIESWGFCTAKGTKILKDDLTYISAEKLNIGDRVLAFDEYPTKNGRRYYKFSYVMNTGIIKLPCYEITLDTGETIVCSDEHKWLCRTISPHGVQSKWTMTKDLLNNYNGMRKYPLGILRLAPTSQFINNYKSGFLAGALDGEGSLHNKRPRITFAQNNNKMLKKVIEYMEDLKIDYSIYNYNNPKFQVGINGGFISTLDLLMKCRPPRLINNWLNYNFQSSLYNLKECVEVKSVKYVGYQDCVALSTDSKTYIAEGYASHNTYKTAAFTWVKQNKKSDGWFWGMGRWTRANAELCLLATKGKPQRINAGVSSLIVNHLREHSQKPDEARDRIVQLVGDIPRIELFARQRFPGWYAWGNELEPSNEVEKEVYRILGGNNNHDS